MLLLAGTNPERHVIRTRLDSFYQQAAASDAHEAHRLAATIEAWWTRSGPPDGVLQLQVGRLQPPGKTLGPQRLWVPQPGQPTPPDTLGMYPRAP